MTSTAVLPAWPDEDHHDEVLLSVDSGLTLSATLDAVLQRHPGASLAEALSSRAAAEAGYARVWFPDSASLNGFHLSDRALDDIGAYENELSLSLPLWMPGEKRAQTAFSETLETSAESMQAELRWQASGALRESLWELEATNRQWQLAREQEHGLAELLAQTQKLAEAGDLSRADELAALQELTAWKSQTLGFEAAYQDAARQYRSLTGLNTLPARFSETPSEQEGIGEQHPALSQAIDRAATAEAAVELARQRSGARPALDVFWRGYRGDRATPEVDSVGVGLTVPIGHSPRRGAEVAQVNQDLAEAQARLIQLRRNLELELHEARHFLNTTRKQLENAEVMLKAGQERNRMDQLSYELGEISMNEWLRRLTSFRTIEQHHALLMIRQEAAIAAYNQAVGDSL